MLADAPAVGGRLREIVSGAIDGATRQGRSCAIALSRPTSEIFGRLADLDGSSVDLFQVDERVAPSGDDARNLTLIERDLGTFAAVARVHAMPIEDATPEDAADAYAKTLADRLGSPPVLDVVHLGVGPDGHTASLLPGDPVLGIRDRWVAATAEASGYRRLTVTYPVIDASRLVVFVVTGDKKADILGRVLRGDDLPAARVAASEVRFLVDEAAANGISGL